MEYQMMRQTIFENRKRQTSFLAFVFVLTDEVSNHTYGKVKLTWFEEIFEEYKSFYSGLNLEQYTMTAKKYFQKCSRIRSVLFQVQSTIFDSSRCNRWHPSVLSHIFTRKHHFKPIKSKRAEIFSVRSPIVQDLLKTLPLASQNIRRFID